MPLPAPLLVVLVDPAGRRDLTTVLAHTLVNGLVARRHTRIKVACKPTLTEITLERNLCWSCLVQLALFHSSPSIYTGSWRQDVKYDTLWRHVTKTDGFSTPQYPKYIINVHKKWYREVLPIGIGVRPVRRSLTCMLFLPYFSITDSWSKHTRCLRKSHLSLYAFHECHLGQLLSAKTYDCKRLTLLSYTPTEVLQMLSI